MLFRSKNVSVAYPSSSSSTGTSTTTAMEDGSKKDIRNEKSIFMVLVDLFIDATAYVVARIVNHPDVRDALSTAILEGAIKLFYVDDLHDHIKNVDAILTEHQVADATKKGKDTTKIVKAYLGGIFSKDDDDDNNDNQNDSGNNRTKTASTLSSMSSSLYKRK